LVAQQLRIGEILLEDGSNYLEELLLFFIATQFLLCSFNLLRSLPVHIMKSILQHSEIETTMVYLHLSNKIVNDALDNVRW
jgi:hypothetical protein